MTVTFETAKRLKDAGFLQPKMQVGQMWYIPEYDTEFAFVSCSPHMNHPTMNGSGGNHFDFFSTTDRRSLNWAKKTLDGLIFAPTATDILLALGAQYSITTTSERKFMVLKTDGSSLGYWVYDEHENPAEAAALAWLQNREQKEEKFNYEEHEE